MEYLYQIINKINGKMYIGVSNNPTRRWNEHINGIGDSATSLIHMAIQKYSKENFDFIILDQNEDRQYILQQEYDTIIKLRTKTPYGYNIIDGGGDPPHYTGENNSFAKINNDTAKVVIQQLQDWKIPLKTIVANNKITHDIVRHINEGSSWHQNDLTYPLRPQERIINQYRVLYIQWMCCSSTIPLNQIGALVGWNRSSAKMINNGKNHYNERLKYPIRQYSDYNKEILSQETCIDYLHFGE